MPVIASYNYLPQENHPSEYMYYKGSGDVMFDWSDPIPASEYWEEYFPMEEMINFTPSMLAKLRLYGEQAKKIYAVDVGTNQLHEKLKYDSKVINIEKTNARYLDKSIIDENIDLIVCDASFISLKKVLKNSFTFLKSPGGIIVALIKPQFEADKKEISRGGVVKNSLVHKKICNEFTKWFNDICNMNVVGIIESPIKGPKGNVEFLIVVKN